MWRRTLATLVTGNAGFIGFHTAKVLLERGDAVVGIDVVNDYYDPAIKEARLKILEETAARTGSPYRFFRANLADRGAVDQAFAEGGVRRAVNLAAQAGVRYSIENPHAYVESNIVGFTNILEACRHGGIEHLVYASTSSVYGANTAMPFSEHVGVDHPLQFYAATKKANELMAHSYSHLYRLPTTGLRFFTVYGPWGRPDMALFLFARAILEGKPINVFNHGNHTRDFTYVDDIVAGVIRARSSGPARSGLGRGPPRSRHVQRALSHLQHRQQRAGQADRLYRGAGGSAGSQGRAQSPAVAAGRRARYVCRRIGPRARSGVQAGDQRAGWRFPLCRMVSPALRRVTRAPRLSIALTAGVQSPLFAMQRRPCCTKTPVHAAGTVATKRPIRATGRAASFSIGVVMDWAFAAMC
jgi:nucleoside-diphosphate-sugar epimerase